MKKLLTISVVLAALFTVSTLNADGLKDSVAKEASKVLKDPSSLKGQEAAKAKVEEVQSKELFETKMDATKFSKEAKQDEEKVESNKTFKGK